MLPATVDLSSTIAFSCADLELVLSKYDTPSAVDPSAVERWLEQAFERADSAATRRLVADVLEDVRAIGEIDDDLTETVIGALGSVEAALDAESGI